MLSHPEKRAAYDASLRNRGVDTAPAHEMRKRPVSLVGVLIVVLGLLAGVRFVRSFRGLLVLSAVIAVAWFGPRLIERLRKPKKPS